VLAFDKRFFNSPSRQGSRGGIAGDARENGRTNPVAGMRTAIKAGLAYFAIVFTVAFLLGILRVFAVAPRLGETGAVLAEVPIILSASRLACGWLVRRLGASDRGIRLAMGGTAFAR